MDLRAADRDLRDTRVMEDIQTEEPIVVPYHELSPEALRGVLESFVLREGTEYGEHEISLEQKVADVMRQLERCEAQIIYNAAHQSIDIVVVKPQSRRNR